MNALPYDEKTVARFWAKVNKNGPVPAHRPELGPCWVWAGGKIKGYGRVKFAGNDCKSHRVSAVLAGMVDTLKVSAGAGAVGNQLVLHKCDNRLCVRPDHFTIGCQKENISQSVRQGRFYQCKTSGEGHVNSKLSTQSVRMIRALRGKFPQTQIAIAFGVKQGVVSGIQLGKSWKHVP